MALIPKHNTSAASGLRNGKDATENRTSQSGPNRGTNTGAAMPGGMAASKKAGAAKRGDRASPASARKGPVTIPGAGRGTNQISGVAVARAAKRG